MTWVMCELAGYNIKYKMTGNTCVPKFSSVIVSCSLGMKPNTCASVCLCLCLCVCVCLNLVTIDCSIRENNVCMLLY